MIKFGSMVVLNLLPMFLIFTIISCVSVSSFMDAPHCIISNMAFLQIFQVNNIFHTLFASTKVDHFPGNRYHILLSSANSSVYMIH